MVIRLVSALLRHLRIMVLKLLGRWRQLPIASQWDIRHEKRKKRDEGRLINTRYGGPNMPKHQPCPLCRAWVKRIRKAMGGAHYYCTKCKRDNFVKAT